jgi:hypothetical protein
MTRIHRGFMHAFSVSIVASLPVIASGWVPTAPDFVSCNAQARDAVKAGSGANSAAVPNIKDRQRADDAQRGSTRESNDAQLSGIDADAAKHPTYQAAYRTCMRRSGF